MTRVLLLGLVLASAACGGKTFDSLCANTVPVPAACNTPCDPSPGATTACPSGYHCNEDGKCDAVCTLTGGQCGSDYSCTADGHCVPNPGGGTGTDTSDACPSVHFTAMKTTPSVQLLLDRSGSMAHNFADQNPAAGDPIKYDTMHTALTGAAGTVTGLQAQVYFGASLFSDDAPCPKLYTVGRALNNQPAIDALIASQSPAGNTPTPPSIDQVVADFAAHPAPTGSPIILLATDGLPNKCGDGNTSTQTESVAAATRAFAAGIKLYVLAVGSVPGATAHFQAMANAGQGVQTGQPNAKYYPATTPADLSMAFQEIIGGVLSCNLRLSGQVDPTTGMGGVVTLNGTDLTYGTDWTLDKDGFTIHILGTACDQLKMSANPVVDATFSCGAVIE